MEKQNQNINEQKPLASIITPCLNGEPHVYRFFDSILAQTYNNIELIFVNNGSSDKTEEIVLSYKIKFESRGIKFIYIFLKDNLGIGGGINAGLSRVTGKYLCWPDSDDYFEPESIEKRVEFLEINPEYGVVSSDAYVRNIDNLDTPIGLLSANYKRRFEPNQFKLLLDEESQFVPGIHMMRTSCFKETHENMSIFPAKRGQNWQMLLPVYYKYKRYYLDEPLFNYIIYKNSTSRGDTNKEDKLLRNEEHEEILIKTLQSMKMPEDEKEKLISYVKIRYARKNNRIAFIYNDGSLFNETYYYLKTTHSANFKDRILNILFKNKFIYKQISKKED